MIDDKGRLFGKVSIVDVVIVLVVVMLAAGYLYRDRTTVETPTDARVMVHIVCPNVYPGVEEMLEVGDRLVAAGALTPVEITELQPQAANWVAANQDGIMVLSQNPFRRDIFLTLEGPAARLTPAEIQFAGQKLRAGVDDFFLKTQKVELKATVIAIEILE